MKRDLIAAAVCVAVLLGVQEARADQFEEYFQEEILYVFAYDRPFPEMSAFSCVKNKLYKGKRTVRDYNGKAVKCKFKSLTRQDYEDLSTIPRTF